jgi:hypothetical protein
VCACMCGVRGWMDGMGLFLSGQAITKGAEGRERRDWAWLLVHPFVHRTLPSVLGLGGVVVDG